MVLNGNWVDLIIIALLIFFALEAYGRPLILEIVDFISFLLAFFVSFRYYNFLAKFFETNFAIPHGLSLVIGFMVTWFLSEAIFYLIVRLLLPKIPRFKVKGAKFLSMVPALLRGLIFISLFLVLLGTFPIQPGIKKSVQESRVGSFLLKNSYRLEQPLKQVFGGITEETLTFLTIKPKTNERVNLGFQTNEFSVDEATEKAMIDLVNKERVSRGLKVLTFDSRLRELGRKHSEDMFKRGYFSHYSPEGKSVADRADQANVNYLVIGENLAFAPTLELAHSGLMNSEGHRANILSADYGKIGIGVIDSVVYGKMFTQVFSN